MCYIYCNMVMLTKKSAPIFWGGKKKKHPTKDRFIIFTFAAAFQHHLMENAEVKVPTVHPSPSRPPRSPSRRMPPRQVSRWQVLHRRRPSDRRRRNLCKRSPICQARTGKNVWGRKEVFPWKCGDFVESYKNQRREKRKSHER